MPASTVVILLSLLLGLQPVTTDLYLPALPALSEGFGADMARSQLTLTALLLAFGTSQLVWGPLSDRFGRRPVLLWGMAVYVVSAVGGAAAQSMDGLIAWRALQGAAMGAAVMGARAIVRDLYQPAEGARVMSRALSGLGVIACVSAPVGGVLAQWLGWRATLGALAVFGAVVLALVAWRYRETAPTPQAGALRPAQLARTWWQIAQHPTFRAYSALAICSYAGLFTFLAASSFVFIRAFGYSKTAYGGVMLLTSLAYIGGTVLCRRLLARLGVRRAVALAGVLSLSGGSALGVLALVGWGSAWYGGLCVLLPVLLFMVGHGIHQPCSQSGAVGPFPQAAGQASALNGFLMMLAAFAVGSWLGQRLDGVGAALVMPLALGMWFWSACIATVAWTWVRLHGDATATATATAPRSA